MQGADRQCIGTLPEEQQGSSLPWAPLTVHGPQRHLTHKHGDSTAAPRRPCGPCRVHGNVGCHHERKPPIPCSAFHPVHGIEERGCAAIACIEGVDSLHIDSAICSAAARSAQSALSICAHAMLRHTHCLREDVRAAMARTEQIPAEAVGSAPRYHGCRARRTGSSGRSLWICCGPARSLCPPPACGRQRPGQGQGLRDCQVCPHDCHHVGNIQRLPANACRVCACARH